MTHTPATQRNRFVDLALFGGLVLLNIEAEMRRHNWPMWLRSLALLPLILLWIPFALLALALYPVGV